MVYRRQWERSYSALHDTVILVGRKKLILKARDYETYEVAQRQYALDFACIHVGSQHYHDFHANQEAMVSNKMAGKVLFLD